MKKIFFMLLSLVVASGAYAVTPANPTNVKWFDAGNESGQSRLTFTLPTVDVDGNELDPEMMGYRIYTDDDQIFTFTRSVYTNDDLWGNITDVYNYQWAEGSDIQGSVVYFYRTNAEGYERFFNTRIGIQAFYLNDNFGIGGVSEIVYDYLPQQTELPKPKNPHIDYWEEVWGPTSQELMFTIETDWDGNPVADDCTFEAMINGDDYTILDADKVTWSIYTDDDQLFVFTPEEFPEFSEPTTEIPFGYSGPYVQENTVYFSNRLATTATENPFFTWRIGIQVHYTVDGVKSSSDIMYLEVFPKMKPATDVTSTSFLADWSSPENNTQHAGFRGYDLYIIDKANPQDTLLIADIPALTKPGELGDEPIPGRTYLVENLTPGTTYQYYVVSKHNWGSQIISIPSNIEEVTLPGEAHGYELGDVNHDGKRSIGDVTALINYLLSGDENGICLICADVDENGSIKIGDVTALINLLLAR